jgi:Zn-finger in ubiquitin-hydrolases and other protein
VAHTCPHVKEIRPVAPNTEGCEECLTTGDRWVHLRVCLTCGHVGCCDSSKNKHATKHFHASGHPIMKSAEPGESWGWCYIDQIPLDSVGEGRHVVARRHSVARGLAPRPPSPLQLFPSKAFLPQCLHRSAAERALLL